MTTPSSGTRRATLIGPAAAGGSSVVMAGAFDSDALVGRQRGWQRFDDHSTVDDVGEAAVNPQRDTLLGQVPADFEPAVGQIGVAVDVDVSFHLERCSGGRDTVGLGAWLGWRPGQVRAAHQQLGQVSGAQVRRCGFDQDAVDDDVNVELVGPHMGPLTGSAHTEA